MNTSAVPCRAEHLTWGPRGGQCLNCGGEGPNTYSVKHIKPFQKIEPKVVTVTIDEEGDVIFLATTENDVFLELGNVVTQRASHVEPVNFFLRVIFHILRSFAKDKDAIAEWTRTWKCLWRVNTKPVGGPVLTWGHVYSAEQVKNIARIGYSDALAGLSNTAVWSDRLEAIRAEVKFLNKFFLEGK